MKLQKKETFMKKRPFTIMIKNLKKKSFKKENKSTPG